MMEKTVGIGVIGLGMGANLLYVNKRTDRASKYVACAPPTRTGRRAWPPNGVFPSRRRITSALLSRDDIQVIGVFSPDHLHAEHALAALNAGKHVICTKPMCTSVEDAVALVETVERTGLQFLVGQTMRFNEEFAGAKALYDEGALGEIIFAEAHYVHDARTFFPLTPWRQTAPQDLMYRRSQPSR